MAELRAQKHHLVDCSTLAVLEPRGLDLPSADYPILRAFMIA